jgi:hypothetical protein
MAEKLMLEARGEIKSCKSYMVMLSETRAAVKLYAEDNMHRFGIVFIFASFFAPPFLFDYVP